MYRRLHEQKTNTNHHLQGQKLRHRHFNSCTINYWRHSCFLSVYYFLRLKTSSFIQATVAYDVYTFVFGLLALVFAVFIWQGKKAGWVGTVAVSLFVIAADSLTLLDLPSIPGIPKFPAITEDSLQPFGCGLPCFKQALEEKYLVSTKKKS